MKFRAGPIIYRAVCEGIINGLQAAREAAAAGNGAPEQIVETVATPVMQKLHEVLVFDEAEEQLLNLQRIAEGMTEKATTETTANPTPQA